MRSATTVRNDLYWARAFGPESRVAELEAELVEARKSDKERAVARQAIREGLPSASHVRLRDGWVEVVRLDDARRELIVAIGVNRQERISVNKVLEVKAL